MTSHDTSVPSRAVAPGIAPSQPDDSAAASDSWPSAKAISSGPAVSQAQNSITRCRNGRGRDVRQIRFSERSTVSSSRVAVTSRPITPAAPSPAAFSAN
ncbi:MAG: hypothetical protein OZX49_01620 [Immundisolibacter sp.]|nr:hypothetical protein [Immundisolibacter sp.]